jgi:hypothetical protein
MAKFCDFIKVGCKIQINYKFPALIFDHDLWWAINLFEFICGMTINEIIIQVHNASCQFQGLRLQLMTLKFFSSVLHHIHELPMQNLVICST